MADFTLPHRSYVPDRGAESAGSCCFMAAPRPRRVPKKTPVKQQPRFKLEFGLFSDGLDPSAADGQVPPLLSDDGGKSTTTTTTTPSFSLFSALPPELRLHVWRQLIQPRIVAVSCVERRGRRGVVERGAGSTTGAGGRVSSSTAGGRRAGHPPMIPVLLHVCREARKLALQHYELSFAWKLPHVLAHAEFDDDDDDEGEEEEEEEGVEVDGASADALAPPQGLATDSAGQSGGGGGETDDGSFPARVWFNFGLDALYLRGPLTASDGYGVAAPVSYFVARSDAWRVRHVALPFAALGIGEIETDQVFVLLFHVVDRFRGLERLLVAAREDDGEARRFWADMPARENVVQKVWRGWVCSSGVVNPKEADREIWLVREAQLDGLVRES